MHQFRLKVDCCGLKSLSGLLFSMMNRSNVGSNKKNASMDDVGEEFELARTIREVGNFEQRERPFAEDVIKQGKMRTDEQMKVWQVTDRPKMPNRVLPRLVLRSDKLL